MTSAFAKHPETLQMNPDYEELLLRSVTTMLRETVYGVTLSPLPPQLAALVVSGTFVSLKRRKHLRGCCGGLHAQPAALGNILPDAINRTVFEDPRFPPVSPSELPYLDVEIWLLFNPQKVRAQGIDRVSQVVTGGKHGVIIHWGEHRGLLLPGVALEHNWDSQTFLEHVCLKAGMHPSRWLEDDISLVTFEGLAIRGPVSAAEQGPGLHFLSEAQIGGYADFCRDNLATLLFGGTPRYSPPGLPDGTISGMILSLDPGNGDSPWQASKIDLHRGLALHATLFQLTQAFAPVLAGAGVAETDLQRLGLAIFYDPILHGGLDEPDLRGFEPARRAVVLFERGRSSLVYCANQEPHMNLREAAERLPVRDPQATQVFSLAADTSHPRITHAAGPQPMAGAPVRPAAMAGKFYPAEPEALRALVDALLGPPQAKAIWHAAMAPHAGLRYSGHVAGAVFGRLKIPKTVLVLGPKHTRYGMDWAIAPHQQWSIPGARLASDPALAQQLTAHVPGLVLDAAAHQQEHGIEVELPFLAKLAPEARVVGMVFGQATYAECREIAVGLANVVKQIPEPPLFVISTDMNHFASDTATRRLDEMALECLDRLDAEALYETCRKKHITMCGMIPAVIVIETLKRLGRLERAERVAYATSADTTGDASRVVGYAGMVFG